MELKEFDRALATIRQGLGVDPNNPQLSKLMRAVKKNRRETSRPEGQPPGVAQQLLEQHANLDEPARRELHDLQVQFNQTARERHSVQANVHMVQRDMQLAELTQSEVLPLPEDQKCYRSIGKIFLRSTKADVVEYLDGQIEEKKKAESDMKQKMEYLERRLKSQQQNMEEILATNTKSDME